MEKINLGLELKALAQALSFLVEKLAGFSRHLNTLDEALERDKSAMELVFQLEEKVKDPAAAPLLEGLKNHLDRHQRDHQALLDDFQGLAEQWKG